MQAVLLSIVSTLNNYLTNYILVILLIAVGLWFSIKTRFVQIRCFGQAIRRLLRKLNLNGHKRDAGMTSFQATAAAIGGQIGTGNIVGACGAILAGGPGAIFWMWLIAFFGMATSYAEITLAVETKEIDADGSYHPGPVYYITKAFKGKAGKAMACFFAVAITMGMGFFATMIQSNAIAETFENAFGIPTWIVGVALVAVCGAIFLGGIRRLSSVVEKLVPVMTGVFFLGVIAVLAARIRYIPMAFGMIFKYAFCPQAIIGGGFGSAMKAAISQGAKRGLLSNEAGMGSTPHIHGQARVKNAHKQGLMGIIGVFMDTFVVLTLNAVVVISTLYTPDGILSGGLTEELAQTVDRNNLAQLAFGSVLGEKLGAVFIAICLFFFAFSSILSLNMYGKINVEYLFRNRNPKAGTTAYMIAALVFVFLGTCASNDLVWELTDLFNNLVVLPNVMALFALTGIIVAVSQKYSYTNIEYSSYAKKEKAMAEEKRKNEENGI